MESNSVREIERIIKDGLIVEVDGKKYSVQDLRKVCDRTSPKAVSLKTLTGLRDYIDNEVDSLIKKELLLIVADYNMVDLVAKNFDTDTGARAHYVHVVLDESGKNFPFGQFMDAEEFTIKLQSMFERNDDLVKLLSFISKLAVNNTIEAEDDGVSQKVAVKSVVSGALKENQIAPSIVTLVPIRTFTEVVQPESKFLFRLRAQEGRLPTCALFGADGGAWRQTAIQNIKDWLEDYLSLVDVIA